MKSKKIPRYDNHNHHNHHLHIHHQYHGKDNEAGMNNDHENRHNHNKLDEDDQNDEVFYGEPSQEDVDGGCGIAMCYSLSMTQTQLSQTESQENDHHQTTTLAATAAAKTTLPHNQWRMETERDRIAAAPGPAPARPLSRKRRRQQPHPQPPDYDEGQGQKQQNSGVASSHAAGTLFDQCQYSMKNCNPDYNQKTNDKKQHYRKLDKQQNSFALLEEELERMEREEKEQKMKQLQHQEKQEQQKEKQEQQKDTKKQRALRDEKDENTSDQEAKDEQRKLPLQQQQNMDEYNRKVRRPLRMELDSTDDESDSVSLATDSIAKRKQNSLQSTNCDLSSAATYTTEAARKIKRTQTLAPEHKTQTVNVSTVSVFDNQHISQNNKKKAPRNSVCSDDNSTVEDPFHNFESEYDFKQRGQARHHQHTSKQKSQRNAHRGTDENNGNNKELLKTSRRHTEKQHKEKRKALQQNREKVPIKEESKEMISSLLSSKKSQHPKSGAVKAVKVVRAKSIVGSRPKHWGPAPSFAASKRPSSHSSARSQVDRKTDISAELRKATKVSSLLQDQRKYAQKGQSFSRSTMPRLSLDSATTTKENANSAATEGAKSSRVSFTPSFLASSLSKKQVGDDVEMVTDLDSSDVNTPTASAKAWRRRSTSILATNHYHSSPLASPHHGFANSSFHQHPSKKAAATGGSSVGYWTKKLRLIRDAQKGDRIRFQSGQYPFSRKVSLDMNDPRNRATSYMDVTLLEQGVNWEEKEHKKITFLSFVHEHSITNNSPHSSSSQEPLAPGRAQGHLAWTCFTFETAREHPGLLKAYKSLRIYNPVVLSTCPAALATLVSPFSETSRPLPYRRSSKIKFWILCTQLCEQYPEHILGKLPSAYETTKNLFHSNTTTIMNIL